MEHANGLIATLTNAEKVREFERGLTIKKIIHESLPIREMCRHAGFRQVAIAIDIHLTRLVANLNLKWNLSDSQIKQIVEDLIEKYPNETIEDFILVFKKARQGEYGELVRLDSPIIFSWMTAYLEEKYQVVEDELMKEKDELYKRVDGGEVDVLGILEKWKDTVNPHKGIKPVPHLEDEEIKAEGQAQPKRGTGFEFNASEAKVRLREHHEQLWKFQELTVRERHPEMSEDEIQERLTELRNTVLANEASVRFSNRDVQRIWQKWQNNKGSRNLTSY